jgi:alpha-methylacyl-CoA racemase
MGPLEGIRIVEIASIGPGPFAGTVLADLGADIIRVDRAGGGGLASAPLMTRGRVTVAADLKTDAGRQLVLDLVARADALIEGFRPGVMERLGLGPEELLASNPRLVYGRMTGYGQDGPLSSVAGHDINYIAVSGALGMIGRTGERPQPPLNLVGDFGGGGMFLALGVVAALLEARTSGQGQVVDAAMTEGSSMLALMVHEMHNAGMWTTTVGENMLDTGAPFYETYATSDGGHVAVGCLEPQFYAEFLRLLDIPQDEMPQWDRDRWPEFKERLAGIFAGRTRAEWAELFEPAEACTTAIYGLGDAPSHPHNVARGSFIDLGNGPVPCPAPRFSRTVSEVRDPGSVDDALARWGVSAAEPATT